MTQKFDLDKQSNGDGLTGQQVETFLREHPAFFEENLELLASLELPHPTSGEMVSLVQRQISILRDQNRSLERKLQELIQIARDNERLSGRLHKFSNNLLEAKSISDVIAVTHDAVRELFEADFVSIKLFEPITDEQQLRISNEQKTAVFADLFAEKKPKCGHLAAAQLSLMFSDNIDQIASSALIPLIAAQDLGLLALGSVEQDRFNPNIGSLFLSHLGDLVSSALASYL